MVKYFFFIRKKNFFIGNLEFFIGVIEFLKNVEFNYKILIKILKDFKI